MKIWKYGVVIIPKYKAPELFKRHIFKGNAVSYAQRVHQRLRQEGLVSVKVEVWSRAKIEEHNVRKWNRTPNVNIKVVE